MRIATLLMMLALAGCAREVSRSYGTPWEEEQLVRCTHLSYCITCMPGFSGKIECCPKFSAFCPGTQPARVKVQPYSIAYNNGKVKHYVNTTTLETLGKCR